MITQTTYQWYLIDRVEYKFKIIQLTLIYVIIL